MRAPNWRARFFDILSKANPGAEEAGTKAIFAKRTHFKAGGLKTPPGKSSQIKARENPAHCGQPLFPYTRRLKAI